MNKTFYRITAALTSAALAGMITACGSAGAPSPEVPDIPTESDKVPETTAPAETTGEAETTAAASGTQNGGHSRSDYDIIIPDGIIPEVTVSDIHIDMPDLSVPDINEYFSDTTEAASQPSASTSAADSSAEEQTITDASGKYSYTGTLIQGGDDKNGYLMIPTGFVNFIDVNSSGRLTQYSDATQKNIFTLAHHNGADYKALADNLKAHKEGQQGVKDIKSSAVTIAGYRAVQLYQYYDDGIDVVNWFIEDPANPSQSTYYLAVEFDSEHDYLLACSSTFQTVEDHNKS